MLVLASRSPRRAELLRVLGVDFSIVDIEVDETRLRDEDPENYVRRLACAKASAGRIVCADSNAVLAADTCVVLNNEILGKPRDRDDAEQMLRRLAGRWHEVFTGVALQSAASEVVCVLTRVLFRELTATEINKYWDTGEPCDKAGAYGIQGLGGALVERIDGSYSNVVGLPLAETLALLNRAGIKHRLSDSS